MKETVGNLSANTDLSNLLQPFLASFNQISVPHLVAAETEDEDPEQNQTNHNEDIFRHVRSPGETSSQGGAGA